MPQALLSTKFNIPAARQARVPRSRLRRLLAQAGSHRLTLVSAPPGYGKTTLVSDWLEDCAVPAAWLSLDEGDNDPVRFLEYFLTALHQVVPAIRLDWLELLQGPQAASFEALMSLVMNEASRAGDVFLVLDDVHVLHAQSILDMLGYLLEHLPGGMHLVLLSRADPPLPLSRLRARGQLLEIRAEQLRFQAGETSQFFDSVMGLALSDPDAAAIEARTEGWVAGLQLAGLAMLQALGPLNEAMRPESGARNFIAAFTGSHAYIMDYLSEEVLRGQPENIRIFLLRTAILDRMCGPLCEAVAGPGAPEPIDGQAMLEFIERSHLFVTALDGERRWYRYHQLFKEVLRRRLEVLYPGQLAALHRRAAEWFEQQGLIHEAVQHATQGGDPDFTARLVEQHGCDLLMGGELVTLAAWLAAVEPYTQTRLWLAMQKAWVLSLSGQPERAERAIAAGEQLLGPLESTGAVRTLRGSLAAARAHWANSQGRPDLAAQYARQALDILQENSDFACSLRIVATSLLGDASLAQGKMEEARQVYADAVQIGKIAGNPHMVMMSLSSLADIYFEQGRLHQAAIQYAEALQMAEQVDGPDSAYAQAVHLGLGKVYYAWNRLAEAAASCERGRQLSRKWENGEMQAACLALAAQIEHASGSLENAPNTTASFEDQLRQHLLSPGRSMRVKTALARFWLHQGKPEQVISFLREVGVLPGASSPGAISLASLPLDAPIPYVLEPAYILLARLFLALGSPDAALNIIARLLPEAKTWERGNTVVELLVLQALALQAKQDLPSALAVLEQAVALAGPEQSTRVFLDEGAPVGRLLYQAKVRGAGGAFVADLFSAINPPAGARLPLSHPSLGVPEEAGARHGQRPSMEPLALIEPLTPRELELLRCIAEGCSNQEIADRLVLSPKTVKRHLSNIYGKLEAKSRTQAVSLARALKLIE